MASAVQLRGNFQEALIAKSPIHLQRFIVSVSFVNIFFLPNVRKSRLSPEQRSGMKSFAVFPAYANIGSNKQTKKLILWK